MQEQLKPNQQLVRMIATSTISTLLNELSRGADARKFLETFTPGDIAHNAAAASYCLENELIPDGYTREKLEQLKNMTMSIFENQTNRKHL